MRTLHSFMEQTIEDMRAGSESWRVKALVAVYAVGGAVINVSILKALG